MEHTKRKDRTLLEVAIALAVEAHAGQDDRAGIEYILHPLRVMLSPELPDDDCRIVAVLHDVIEDTDVTIQHVHGEFGEKIRDAVDALSHRKDEPYREYWNRIRRNPVALQVKLADARDNLSRAPNLPEPDRSLMNRKYENTILYISGQNTSVDWPDAETRF